MSNTYSEPNQFSSQPSFQQQPPRSGAGFGCFLVGCLGMLVLCVVLCAGSVWYVRNNADRWIAGWAGQFIAAMVNESEIPEQEKGEVIAQVDRVVQAYKDRQIDQEDLERIMEQLQESPIFALLSSYGLEQRYIDPSGLPEEEKQLARRTIKRAMRGVLEKKIEQETFNNALPDFVNDESLAEAEKTVETEKPADPAATPENVPATDDSPVTSDETASAADSDAELSDQEVQEFVARLKKLADEAEIPDEDYQIDIGDEVKRVVDAALSGSKTGPGGTGK